MDNQIKKNCNCDNNNNISKKNNNNLIEKCKKLINATNTTNSIYQNNCNIDIKNTIDKINQFDNISNCSQKKICLNELYIEEIIYNYYLVMFLLKSDNIIGDKLFLDIKNNFYFNSDLNHYIWNKNSNQYYRENDYLKMVDGKTNIIYFKKNDEYFWEDNNSNIFVDENKNFFDPNIELINLSNILKILYKTANIINFLYSIYNTTTIEYKDNNLIYIKNQCGNYIFCIDISFIYIIIDDYVYMKQLWEIDSINDLNIFFKKIFILNNNFINLKKILLK